MPEFGYRKMFEDLDAHEPDVDALNKLATIMSKLSRVPDAPTTLERISDFLGFSAVMKFLGFSEAEPKPIPAGYTYLAQFISHDITFDKNSDRHVRTDLPFSNIPMTPEIKPMTAEEIKSLINLRKPNFDLETIYGYKEPLNPSDPPRPEKEPRRQELMQNHPLPLLKLGDTDGVDSGTAGVPYPNDLPRKDESPCANIVDQRNDENLLLAQTQVAFIKFHNAIVLKLSESEKYKPESEEYKKEELFDKARKLAIRYYQTIILEDFLPRIVQESILKDVIAKAGTKELFYQPKRDGMYMPLEYAVAAVRAGHSMIRDDYGFNKNQNKASLVNLMHFTGRGMASATPVPQSKLPSTWIINWYLFYDIDDSRLNPAFNRAKDIDTDISSALQNLRPKSAPETEKTDGRENSLPTLDLFRGRRLGLPTGQDVAGKLREKIPDIEVLPADKIGKLIDTKEIILTSDEDKLNIKKQLREAFSEKSPLWFYLLAEAEFQFKDGIPEDKGKLGAVGSRIVAETFIQLLYESEYSILQTNWEPDEEIFFNSNKISSMPEMLKFIRDTSKEHFKLLYPGREEFFNEHYPGRDYRFDELNPLGES